MVKNYTKTPLSRRIFFWSLVFTYLVIASTVIFFSLGYRFNFDKNVIIYSGSLNIKSNPNDIDIHIDNNKKQYNSYFNIINNSYNVTGLRFGLHDVKITSNGYKDWQKKDVRIKSGYATEFWNVILVKNYYERTIYNATDLKKVFFAPRYELMIYPKTNNKDKSLVLSIINTDKNLIENTLKDNLSKFNFDKNENIEWSPDTFRLSVPIKRNVIKIDSDNGDDKLNKAKNQIDKKDKLNTKTNEKKIEMDDYLIVYRNNNINFSYLSDIIKTNKSTKKIFDNNPLNDLENKNFKYNSIKNVRFYPKDSNYIYAIIDDNLYLINITNNEEKINKKESIQKIFNEILAYDITEDGIYVLNKSGLLMYSENYNFKENIKILTVFENTSEMTNNRLIAYDKNRALLISGSDKTLYVYNKKEDNSTTKIIGKNIMDARFSNDGKKIIFRDNRNIKLYMTRDWQQPKRKMDTIYEIAEMDENIQKMEWLEDYEHVITQNGNVISLIDLDHRFRSNIITKIIERSTEEETDMIYKSEQNKLFFVDSIDNINTLQSIYFPNKKRKLLSF